jgi:aldehyde:ferredoxin oxidoreductase
MLRFGRTMGRIVKSARKRKRQLPINILPYPRVISAVIGRRFYLGDFLKVGERAFNMERLFNVREGISRKDDVLPERFLKECSTDDPRSIVPLDKMLPRYYEVRGWDEDGIPKKETLELLGIEV